MTKTQSNNIDICLTDKCNYTCPYCVADYIRTNAKINVQELLEFLTKFFEKHTNITHITLTGEGEPTLHEDLSYLVDYLSKNAKISIHIETNLSQSIEYYCNLMHKSENIYIVCSWHSTKYDNLNKEFFIKIKQLKTLYSSRVQIITTIEPNNLHNSYLASKILSKYNASNLFVIQDSSEFSQYPQDVFKLFNDVNFEHNENNTDLYINFNGAIYQSYFEYLRGKTKIGDIVEYEDF